MVSTLKGTFGADHGVEDYPEAPDVSWEGTRLFLCHFRRHETDCAEALRWTQVTVIELGRKAEVSDLD